jgi:hypothetical protein
MHREGALATCRNGVPRGVSQPKNFPIAGAFLNSSVPLSDHFAHPTRKLIYSQDVMRPHDGRWGGLDGTAAAEFPLRHPPMPELAAFAVVNGFRPNQRPRSNLCSDCALNSPRQILSGGRICVCLLKFKNGASILRTRSKAAVSTAVLLLPAAHAQVPRYRCEERKPRSVPPRGPG